ncbi:uncharacterized protein ACIB01_014783 [Guaruba guarouba]
MHLLAFPPGDDSTGQDSTDSTGEGKTAHNSTGQDRTGQHSTAQDRTGQHSTGEGRTAHNSTAQHSTGQDSTAQERAGQAVPSPNTRHIPFPTVQEEDARGQAMRKQCDVYVKASPGFASPPTPALGNDKSLLAGA